MSGTGPNGHTPSERGMFTSVSCVEGWLEGGCVAGVMMISRSARCIAGTGSSKLVAIAALSAIDFSVLKGSGAFMSGVELN